MNYTTIPEISQLNNLSVNSIRFQLYKNKVEPIDNVRWTINGYVGKPFKKEDVEKVLSKFIPQSERIKIVSEELQPILKRYTSEEVCKVLRNHLKSSLWNKQISSWNVLDFKEFEKLKNENI